MNQLDWHCADDYKFTAELDGAGWAWEFLRRNPEYLEDWVLANALQENFLRHQDGRWYNAHRNPHGIFDPPLPSDKSPGEWVTREGVELNAPMAWYGKKWRLLGHIQDPSCSTLPPFELPVSTKLLGWDELPQYFSAVDEESDILVQGGEIAVVGINMSRAFSSIEADLKKIIIKEKTRRSISKAPPIQPKKKANWPMFLRILDAKRQNASHADIGAILLPNRIEADAKSAISQYLSDDIPRLSKPDVYIRFAASQG